MKEHQLASQNMILFLAINNSKILKAGNFINIEWVYFETYTDNEQKATESVKIKTFLHKWSRNYYWFTLTDARLEFYGILIMQIAAISCLK